MPPMLLSCRSAIYRQTFRLFDQLNVPRSGRSVVSGRHILSEDEDTSESLKFEVCSDFRLPTSDLL